jgi:tetratricopeptide (TPR) repeat protein
VAAAVPWLTQLHADRRLVTRLAPDSGGRSTALSSAAPRLADSKYGDELDTALGKLPRERVERDPGLALAMGRRALVRDQPNEGLKWLVRAQTAVSKEPPALIARIAFQLGGAYVTRSELAPADAVLAWAEGLLGRHASSSPDLEHLRALIADVRGQRDDAMTLYRRAIERGATSLTPMSRVLALRNLAEAISHSEPQESVALYGLALATIDADELDETMRSALDNTMGYALLCAGDIDGGQRKLRQALADARRIGRRRIELYAQFNLAIVAELGGELVGAAAELAAVSQAATHAGLDDLARWSEIRSAWLDARSGDRESALARIRRAFPAAVPVAYRDTVATLRSLLDLDGPRAAGARAELAKLAGAYRSRGDELTAFAVTLWVARADAKAGRVSAARRNIATACEIGSRRGFRVATNWWASEIVEVARRQAPAEFAEYVEGLIAPPGIGTSTVAPDVLLTRDGAIHVDGAPFDEAGWRSGRTGSRVLQRYFRALVAAYPAALGRDELADLLWPDSEGDKAVRNLYASTNDLRRVLASVPGVSLAVVDQRYRLDVAPQVRMS